MMTSSEHTQLTLFITHKTCTQCGHTKPLTDYYAHKKSRDGRQAKCKTCDRANKLAWREANPERHRANNRAWYANNRERRRANNRAWQANNRERSRANNRAWREANPEKTRAIDHRRRARKHSAVPQRWTRNECPNHLCYWCGTTLTPNTTHIDHIMPLALHGTDTPNNRAHTCVTCNLSKGGTHPLVWIAQLVTNN